MDCGCAASPTQCARFLSENLLGRAARFAPQLRIFTLMPAHSAHPVPIKKVDANQTTETPDLLAVEEPLEIRIEFGKEGAREQKSISVTMRTPGNDLELALGFLFTEGIINSYTDVANIHHCADPQTPEERENVVKAELNPNLELDLERLQRHFYTTSSCGVCGKASIEAVEAMHCPVLPVSGFSVAASLVHSLPDRLRKEQAVFEHTGGIHAAALFDAEGKLQLMREDVGRHNAVDKLIGAALFKGLIPLSQSLILVSGRASFELVQKSLAAGIPVLAAVGAPSSLAVSLATEFNMTVLGFVRNNRFNIYSADHRINTTS